MATKHEAPASTVEREGGERRGFAEWYQEWRRSVDLNELITNADDPFANVRGKFPGREISLEE